MAAGLALSVKRLAGFAEIGANRGLLACILLVWAISPLNASAQDAGASTDRMVAEYFGSAPSYKTIKYSREQVANLLQRAPGGLAIEAAGGTFQPSGLEP